MPFSFTEAPIASRQNRRIVGLCKLADRGERERTGLFRFDGVKLLCEAVRREVPLTAVFVRAGSAGRVTERMAELYGLEPDALGCPAYAVEDSLFDRISEENAPEGVICVAKALDKRHKMYTINGKDFPPVPAGPAVLLESLRDPANVGAVIRTAAALGVGNSRSSASSAMPPESPKISLRTAATLAFFSTGLKRLTFEPASTVKCPVALS